MPEVFSRENTVVRKTFSPPGKNLPFYVVMEYNASVNQLNVYCHSEYEYRYDVRLKDGRVVKSTGPFSGKITIPGAFISHLLFACTILKAKAVYTEESKALIVSRRPETEESPERVLYTFVDYDKLTCTRILFPSTRILPVISYLNYVKKMVPETKFVYTETNGGENKKTVSIAYCPREQKLLFSLRSFSVELRDYALFMLKTHLYAMLVNGEKLRRPIVWTGVLLLPDGAFCFSDADRKLIIGFRKREYCLNGNVVQLPELALKLFLLLF